MIGEILGIDSMAWRILIFILVVGAFLYFFRDTIRRNENANKAGLAVLSIALILITIIFLSSFVFPNLRGDLWVSLGGAENRDHKKRYVPVQPSTNICITNIVEVKKAQEPLPQPSTTNVVEAKKEEPPIHVPTTNAVPGTTEPEEYTVYSNPKRNRTQSIHLTPSKDGQTVFNQTIILGDGVVNQGTAKPVPHPKALALPKKEPVDKGLVIIEKEFDQSIFVARRYPEIRVNYGVWRLGLPSDSFRKMELRLKTQPLHNLTLHERSEIEQRLYKLLDEFHAKFRDSFRDNNDYDNPDDPNDQEKLREKFKEFLLKSHDRHYTDTDWRRWISNEGLSLEITFSLYE